MSKYTIHTRKEFASTDSFLDTPESLILAYYNRELGSRSYLTQEANIDELKVLICAFLNRLGGRIYIGIDPDSKQVIGIPVDNVDAIITDIYSTCSKISPNPMTIPPKVHVVYLPIMDDGVFASKYILKVFIDQGERTTIYDTFSSQSYYRTNEGTNGKYTFAEYSEEYQKRVRGEFEYEHVLFHDEVDHRAEDELNSKKSFDLNIPIHAFESSTLEYKWFREIGDFPKDQYSNSATNKRTLTRTICSFLNTYGGRIYLGISDQRKIIGIDEARAAEMKVEILNCLSEVSPKVDDHIVQVEILDVEDSRKKILKVKVQPGDLDKIYSLTTRQFGAYWRNGPSCQLYKMSHYRKEMGYRIAKTFHREKVIFSDDIVAKYEEPREISECRKLISHSLYHLQRDYLYKWEAMYHLEGFSFPREVEATIEVSLGLQHLLSDVETDIELALEFLESGLESAVDYKRYQALISVIAIYILKNQPEKAKNNYSEALKLVEKRRNDEQLYQDIIHDDKFKEFAHLFEQLVSPDGTHSEVLTRLNLEIIHIVIRLKQGSFQVKDKVLREIEGVLQETNTEGIRSQKLSIEAMKDQVLDSVLKFPVTIVYGGTGSGKTTQLPRYLREIYPEGRIALCQPYKESLASLLDRIRGQISDKKVFQITHLKQHDEDNAKAASEKDGVVMMTHTTMLFEMLYDPNFEQYKCIIIDEPHERLIDTDVLIAFMILMLKENKSSTPRFILSSATLDADHIVRVLGKNNCNIIEINPTQSYEVVDHNESIAFGVDQYKDNSDPEQAVRLIKKILDENHESFNGHVLIFAPGQDHVSKLREFAESHNEISEKFHILCVYGNNQNKSYSRELFGDFRPKFKLIISTKVTQTAITISDLAVVIDSGWESVMKFNRWIGAYEQTWMKISRSTSTQRRGRLGRTCNGAFYPLYSAKDKESMAEFERNSMDKYSCSQQILWMLRYKRNAFTMKMLSEVQKSKDPQIEAVLAGVFREMNYCLQRPDRQMLSLDAATIRKEMLTLDDNEDRFKTAVNNVIMKSNIPNKITVKKLLNDYYKNVCKSLQNYNIFDITFIDNEWYFRCHFSQLFLQKIDQVAHQLKGVRDLVHWMLEIMNPCLKCNKTPIDPIVPAECCLNCSQQQVYDDESLVEFTQRLNLTLNYKESYLTETISMICWELKLKHVEGEIMRHMKDALEELEVWRKLDNVYFSNSMPSTTKICLTEDILSLYFYGLVTGLAKTNELKNWNSNRLTLGTKVDMLSRITLTPMGVFASEIDHRINTAVCLYKSIELGCESEMAKLLAIQSQDWFLFSTRFEDSLGSNKKTRKDIMRQWMDNNDELETEVEIYVKIYNDIKSKLTELVQQLDLPADTTISNYALSTAIKPWAKSKHLDDSYFGSVEENYLYWEDNITKLKERFCVEHSNDEERFKLRKAIYYGNWQSVGYGKLVKGKTEDDNKMVYSLANLHDRDEIRYNLRLASIVEDVGSEKISGCYFVCFSELRVQNPRFKQDQVVYPLEIRVSCTSTLEANWIKELPEPLRNNAISIGKSPKQHLDIEHALFNEDLHEKNSIFVKAKRGIDHFYHRPQDLRAELKEVPFFDEKYLLEMKAKDVKYPFYNNNNCINRIYFG